MNDDITGLLFTRYMPFACWQTEGLWHPQPWFPKPNFLWADSWQHGNMRCATVIYAHIWFSRNVRLPCCHVLGSTLGVVIIRLSLKRQMYVLCLLKGGLSYDHHRNHLRIHRVLVLSVVIHIYNLIIMHFYKQYEATHPQCRKRHERSGRKGMQKFTWMSMEVPELWEIIGPRHTQDKIRNLEIVRAQKKLSTGRPKALPKPCNVVTGPQV